MATKFNLDKLDLQIISAMMEDAGISYADLGKKLFVSGGTIHVRIKKLQELIGACAGKDPEKDTAEFAQLKETYDEFSRKLDMLQDSWGHRAELPAAGEV